MPKLELYPLSTALVVVDMQNAYAHRDGSMAKLGLPNDVLRAAIVPIQRLCAAARSVGVPVVFVRFVLRPDYKDAGLRRWRFPQAHAAGSLVRGTWDAEIVDELRPEPTDFVVDKTRYSGFYHTNLDDVLRGQAVDTLIVCGATTDVCVDSTVRDAYARDYHVVVPSDAVAAYDAGRHRAALKILTWGFARLATTAQVEAALTARAR